MGILDKWKKNRKNTTNEQNNQNHSTQQRENEFFLGAEEIEEVLEWTGPEGCVCSDMVTKQGWKVGYMYREDPVEIFPDSGWRFFKGDEDEEYCNDVSHHQIFRLNTICNYDPSIISYLNRPVGTCLAKQKAGTFVEDDGSFQIFMEKIKS